MAQWLTGAIQPTASPSPLSLLLPRDPLSIHLRFLCVYTRMPYSAGKRNRHALPLIRISVGRLQCSPVFRCIRRYPQVFSSALILSPFPPSVNYLLTRGVECNQNEFLIFLRISNNSFKIWTARYLLKLIRRLIVSFQINL